MEIFDYGEEKQGGGECSFKKHQKHRDAIGNSEDNYQNNNDIKGNEKQG